jgi:hypothetical protein
MEKLGGTKEMPKRSVKDRNLVRRRMPQRSVKKMGQLRRGKR